MIDIFHAHTDAKSKERILTTFCSEGSTVRILICTVAVGSCTQLSLMIYIFYLIFYLTFNLKRADKFASLLQITMSFPCVASYDLFLNT